VEDGLCTLFWQDNWLDGGTLKCRFSRLFYRSTSKMETLSDIFLLGWEEGCSAWRRRRRLFVWEEELVRECCVLLSSIFLQDNMNDKWIWHLHVSLKYNVTSVYNILTSRVSSSTHDHNTYFWHKEVPLKVNIFVWRLLRNRLPTTDNLIRCRILQSNTHYCSSGCGSSEDIDHLFLSCDFYEQIWYDIYNWLGIVTVKPAHVKDH